MKPVQYPLASLAISKSAVCPVFGVPPKVPLTYTPIARGAQARNVAPPPPRLAPIGVVGRILACESMRGPPCGAELNSGGLWQGRWSENIVLQDFRPVSCNFRNGRIRCFDSSPKAKFHGPRTVTAFVMALC